jgi:sRNA-binding regulator protein Hfq
MRRRRRTRDGIAEAILMTGQANEQTNAEVMYLATLIQNKTPVLVKLLNDQEVSGWIEYYDKSFIRLTRNNEPNLFIYKDQIRYIAEVGGATNQRGRRANS